LTKTDIRDYDKLDESEKKAIQEVKDENNATVLTLSNITGNGVFNVKKNACDILQKYRETLSKDITTGGLLSIK